jgi:hypothetical protein
MHLLYVQYIGTCSYLLEGGILYIPIEHVYTTLTKCEDIQELIHT